MTSGLTITTFKDGPRGWLYYALDDLIALLDGMIAQDKTVFPPPESLAIAVNNRDRFLRAKAFFDNDPEGRFGVSGDVR